MLSYSPCSHSYYASYPSYPSYFSSNPSYPSYYPSDYPLDYPLTTSLTTPLTTPLLPSLLSPYYPIFYPSNYPLPPLCTQLQYFIAKYKSYRFVRSVSFFINEELTKTAINWCRHPDVRKKKKIQLNFIL